MTRASGQYFDRASASAPEPVHRSTISGRGRKRLRRQPIPAATSVSGRGMKTPGPTCNGHRAERGGPTMCCNGIRAHALRSRVARSARRSRRRPRSSNGSRPRLGARGMRGQLFGVDARRCRLPPRPALPRRASIALQRARRRHACCSRDCLSAAASASNNASRSPSSTWSRLCALKLIR